MNEHRTTLVLLFILTATVANTLALADNPVVPASHGKGFSHGQLVNSSGGVISAATESADATHTHVGLDIAAPRGSDILTFAPGVVSHIVGESATCESTIRPRPKWCYLGYMVLIRHENGLNRSFYTVYLHMDGPPLVARGQNIQTGQKIGVVGSTGAGAGPHTHFEIRYFSDTLYPGWGNIYGPGDLRESATLLENWADPDAAFRDHPGGVNPVNDELESSFDGSIVGQIAILILMLGGLMLVLGAKKTAKRMLLVACAIAVAAAFI